jgi:regulator of protease activity HflC (stomatin/prohibitin superfamily)
MGNLLSCKRRRKKPKHSKHMSIIIGMLVGFVGWFLVRYLVAGFYTVDQNERAVKTSFGRAERIEDKTTLDDPIADSLRKDERDRYVFPQVRVIQPGGPYWKWPWEKVYKISVATQTVNMAFDPENPLANQGGRMLEAVTKDQLNVGLTGQIRYRASERNLYAFIFGVKNPFAHIMGYFVSVLRERIATFEAPVPMELVFECPQCRQHLSVEPGNAGAKIPCPSCAKEIMVPRATDAGVKLVPSAQSKSISVPLADGQIDTPDELASAIGISINDLRKNLRDLNEHMDRECRSSSARYGMVLDASLITGIDPPEEVESALAAINTAHNQVSSDISLAQASADQKIVQSKRAVEIETLKAQTEVEPLERMAHQLTDLKNNGPGALEAYRRNVRLALFEQAEKVFVEVEK